MCLTTTGGIGGLKKLSPFMKVKLEILQQVNDHDGYCSGEECAYSERVLVLTDCVPSTLGDLPIGANITEHYQGMALSFMAPGVFMHAIPTLNNDGSFYCGIGKDGRAHDLVQHDYRLTVVNATVVDDISCDSP